MLYSDHSATRNADEDRPGPEWRFLEGGGASLIELASRESGSLRVALLWRREIDVVTVLVTDSATENGFELVVEDRNALDVYYHPYAYAALRGVEFGVAA